MVRCGALIDRSDGGQCLLGFCVVLTHILHSQAYPFFGGGSEWVGVSVGINAPDNLRERPLANKLYSMTKNGPDFARSCENLTWVLKFIVFRQAKASERRLHVVLFPETLRPGVL